MARKVRAPASAAVRLGELAGKSGRNAAEREELVQLLAGREVARLAEVRVRARQVDTETRGKR